MILLQQKANVASPLMRGKGDVLKAQRVAEDVVAKDTPDFSVVEACFLLEEILE